MESLDPLKKPEPTQGWHRADIKAALEKEGWSLRKLGAANGYKPDSLKAVLQHPYPRMEKIVARAIGVTPQTIWPSRYGPDGKPNRPIGVHHHKLLTPRKHTPPGRGRRNVKYSGGK